MTRSFQTIRSNTRKIRSSLFSLIIITVSRFLLCSPPSVVRLITVLSCGKLLDALSVLILLLLLLLLTLSAGRSLPFLPICDSFYLYAWVRECGGLVNDGNVIDPRFTFLITLKSSNFYRFLGPYLLNLSQICILGRNFVLRMDLTLLSSIYSFFRSLKVVLEMFSDGQVLVLSSILFYALLQFFDACV